MAETQTPDEANEQAREQARLTARQRRAAEQAQQQSGEEPRYTHEQLVEFARAFFDTTPSAVRAALACTEEETLTVDEAKAIVEENASREVEHEPLPGYETPTDTTSED